MVFLSFALGACVSTLDWMFLAVGCEQSPEYEAQQNCHHALCMLYSPGRLLDCTEQVAVRSHCSTYGEWTQATGPKTPIPPTSVTDQDDTVIFNRLLLTQVPVESKD